MYIMDEISYWIFTKRAPCLMNYDNIIKRQQEEAQCSKNDNKPVYEIVSPPQKRKKRQLAILDETSVSTEKQQNVYFEVSQKQIKPVLNSADSDTLGSDVEFNIKNSAQDKRKKPRLQKNNQTLNKKNKVVTSTPKVPVRRSLRQAQQHNPTHLNSSFETFHASLVNGAHYKNNVPQAPVEPVVKPPVAPAEEYQEVDKKNISLRNKCKPAAAQNGQFEELSDVSGFTANYIRSTKVQANRSQRKPRCKNSRHLVKEAQDVSNMVVCVNKSTNTGLMNNNSTDSSQNALNLVTLKNHKGVDKPSQSKFIDKKSKRKECLPKDNQKNKTNLNISFQSQSSGVSRYPKRNKSHNNITDNGVHAAKKRKTNQNGVIEFNNSDKKENPEDKPAVRTRGCARAARSAGLTVSHQENSVLVLSNSTEQVSTETSMNVATPKNRRTKRSTRQSRNRKSANKTEQSLNPDSLRDKSGFAACFSDSDNESGPLRQKKYFCA